MLELPAVVGFVGWGHAWPCVGEVVQRRAPGLQVWAAGGQGHCSCQAPWCQASEGDIAAGSAVAELEMAG